MPSIDRSFRAAALAALALLVLGAPLAFGQTPGETTSDLERSGFDSLVRVLTLRSYNTRLVVLSTTLLGVTSGLVGTFLLLRKRSLMGDALSHATLPGIALAFLLSTSLGGQGKALPLLLFGASVSGVLGVLLMLAIRRTTLLKDDVAMGFVLSVFFGLGVALLGMAQTLPQASAAGLESFIYGKTASMVLADFTLIATVTAAAITVSLLLKKEFTLLCFDEGFAASEGWPTLRLDVIMLALVTAVTVIGLQSVGLILIIAFLITPAAAARFWTWRLNLMLPIAAVIGGASGWIGASISALFPRLPAGAVIVLVAAAIFTVSLLAAPARGVIPRYLRHARLRRKVGRQHLLRAAYEILEAQRRDPARPVRNLPFPRDLLLTHRSWSPARLRGLLRHARGEDHLEPAEPGMLRLSEAGFGEAARVTRNHRLWELYLIRHADIAPSHVDRDADMVEHVLGADLVRGLERELADGESPAAVPPSPHQLEATSTPGAPTPPR